MMMNAWSDLLLQIRMWLLLGSEFLLASSLIGRLLKSDFLGGRPVWPPSFQEKRKAPRLRSRALMELEDSGGRYLADSARLHDISVRGACFHSSLVMEVGKQIKARLFSSHIGML